LVLVHHYNENVKIPGGIMSDQSVDMANINWIHVNEYKMIQLQEDKALSSGNQIPYCIVETLAA